MANDGKQPTFAEVVGGRLRLLRSERGLRQADVAAAAARWGLPWGRSSVAALEGGSRNLSIEEALVLPMLIAELGGWDKALIPDEAEIALTPTRYVKATHLLALMSRLTSPVAPDRGDPLEGVSYGVLGKSERSAPVDSELHGYEAEAEDAAWRLMCARVYPYFDYRKAELGAHAGSDWELLGKVARRLSLPDGFSPSWGVVALYSQILYKSTFEEERDGRVAERDLEGRSLQSAKGHVTREMIAEINDVITYDWPEIERVFHELSGVRGDREALANWTRRARSEANSLVSEARRHRKLLDFRTDHPEVAEAFAQIGRELREGREASGLSVQDVAEATMQRWDSIKQIEEGTFFMLSPVRGESYIRAIARAVGVPAGGLVERFLGAMARLS
ncbi:helix-turn-helix domain-containing protein [Streptomyces griseus]|uniref:helix-turn-helix domain-containing protein n=1 Tax=Streptomyces griseus TaxID=1911 RepID=UPI003804523E